MADLITDLVEGLGLKTIYYYNGAETLSETKIIENKFEQIDISAIVMNQEDLNGRTPEQVLKLVYENQLDGWGIFTNSKTDTLMLIVNNDGNTTFSYYSENPKVVEELEAIGNPVDTDTGNFILENLNSFEDAVNTNETESEISVEEPEETTSTNTTTTVIPDDSSISSNTFAFDTIFTIIPIVIFIIMIWSFIKKVKTTNDKASNTKKLKNETKEDVTPPPVFKKLFSGEEELIEENKELNENLNYQKSLYYSNIDNCFVELRKLQKDFLRLWNTVKNKNNVTELQSLAIKYKDSLDRLNRVVSKDYWGSIATHPQDWNEPEKRLQGVREAIIIIEKDITRNIKRVNDDLALDFDLELQIIKNQDNTPDFNEFK